MEQLEVFSTLQWWRCGLGACEQFKASHPRDNIKLSMAGSLQHWFYNLSHRSSQPSITTSTNRSRSPTILNPKCQEHIFLSSLPLYLHTPSLQADCNTVQGDVQRDLEAGTDESVRIKVKFEGSGSTETPKRDDTSLVCGCML